MDGIVAIAGVIVLLLLIGGAIGAADRRRFSLRWLIVAASLVALNDLLLTRAYGAVPDLFVTSQWNWQGKLLALAASLAIAALPTFGWRRAGITISQQPGSLRAALPVAAVYCLIFVGLALAFPASPANGDEVRFQLTMPGLEEEIFYRGILLLALDRAFTARVRFLGIEWGWGAVLSCALFGLAHAFGYSDGQFSFDPLTMALTALPSAIAVWLRVRTGSLLLPIALHNFGNAIGLII